MSRTVLLLAGLAMAAVAAESPEAHLPAPDDAASGHLAAGDQAAKDGAWASAAKAYQALLACGRSALCAVGPDQRIGARRLGRLRLRALPPDGRKAYRALFDAVARPLFEAGRRQRDAAALAEVGRLYPLSSHGPEAWELLGDLAWEAGRAGQAARAFRLAQEAQAAPSARLLMKRAVCLARLGQVAEAERVLDDARRSGPAKVTLAGETREAATLDAGWLRAVAGAVEPRASTAERPGRCVWRRPLWEKPAAFARLAPQHPWTALLPTHAGGLVLVHNDAGVAALDEFTGEVVWRHEPPMERKVATTLVFGPGGGGPLGVSVGGSRVYASYVQRTSEEGQPQILRRVCVLDLASGRVLRELGAEADEDGLVDRLSFCAAPVESEGVVYAAAFVERGYSDFYALAFEAETGRLLWKAYLFSGEGPRTLYLGPGHSGPLTLADGLLYFASNSGAVGCVDTLDGSAAWVRSYERTGGFWNTRRGQPVTPWPGWRNAPLVQAGTVLVVPCDSESILGLDAATGELRWERPRGGHVFVHGASHGTAVLAGRELEALDLATGKTLWRRTAEEDVQARGVGVVGERVALCPTVRGLLALDLATGREVARDGGIVGHYVPGRSTGLVAGYHELAGHVSPASAIERERLRVAAAPQALEPRFRLALALQLGGEEEAAVGELRAALKLCEGQEGSLPGRVREAAWRLFLALGERSEAAGRLDESMARYRAAAAATASSERRIRSLLGVARCCRARRDWPSLVALYQDLLEREPDTPYPFADRVAYAASVYAEREIARVVAEHGRDVYARFERAAAELAPEAAIGRYPNSLAARRALRELAEAARRRGDDAAAARHYAALLRRAEPDSGDAAQAAYRLLDCLERAGDLACARQLLLAMQGASSPRVAAFAQSRLRSPLYVAAPQGDGSVLSAVSFPVVHAWTAKPAGLQPMELRGPRAPELDGVVFARDARTLYCLEAATGEERWQVDLASEGTHEQSLAVRLHGGLLVVYGGRHVYALEARTGDLRWKRELGQSSARVPRALSWWGRLELREVPLPAWCFAGDAVYAATLDARVVCLDGRTGEQRWGARLPGKPISELQRLGDRLAVATEPGCRVAMVDAASGKVLQVATLLEETPGLVPTWAGDALVVIGQGGAVAFDVRSGERRWLARPPKSGKMALERFGSRLVLLSTAGSLSEIDVTTGAVGAQREVGPFLTYLRAGDDLFLFCPRHVEGAMQLTVEAYEAPGLAHLWFATLPATRVYDAVATARCLLVSAHGTRRIEVAPGRVTAVASIRDVVVLDRQSGAQLGTLDLTPFQPHSLTTFVPWPRLLLSTVHSVMDEVAGQRLVAFSGGETGPRADAGGGDELLKALREGRITTDGLVALTRRHAKRGAFEEAFDILDRGVAGAGLSDTDYLRLGDAQAQVCRAAITAERPTKTVYELDWRLPRPLALDRFRHFAVAEARDGPAAGRWSGAGDLSAQVYLAHTSLALCLHAVVRDDVHRPGAVGDRVEVLLARWQTARRQWGERDLQFSVAAGEQPEVEFGRFPADSRGVVRVAAARDAARKLTTYSVVVPWRALGEFAARPGAMLDFAVAVHDDDGRGPKGALRWGLFEPQLTGHLHLR